jgi:hypothetical protein
MLLFIFSLFYPNSVERINNVKLNIKLSYTKLKERFLKKKEKNNGF